MLRTGQMTIFPKLRSKIPIFTTVAQFREWRQSTLQSNSSVGFVPTMGALHEGHLSLVRRSLSENCHTVVSIFVNPAQFAPHEDLATYPRTIESDLRALEKLQETPYAAAGQATIQVLRQVDGLFLPSVAEMYPSGIAQDVALQIGTFVDVKGYSDKMEGQSRPTFFRGVATIVLKLFNVIQPTSAYFGQKDIQQALLLRQMCRDLLVSYPKPANLHIVPTARDPADGLALSSRNLYLSPSGRKFASIFPKALDIAVTSWQAGLPKAECVRRAVQAIDEHKNNAGDPEFHRLTITLDYLDFHTAGSFENLSEDATVSSVPNNEEAIIVSGALWIDKTRLIDNRILGNVGRILSLRP